jgi:adenosylhomocysteine nucleosidase
LTNVPASSDTAAPAPVAIVTAMREEFAPLLARLQDGHVERVGSLDVQHGRLGGARVLLAQCGEGRLQAEEAVETLLERFPISLLLVLGTAGGLQPGLRVGAIVVAESVRSNGDETWDAAEELVERAIRHGARRGTILSSATMLCSAEDKARVWNEAGLDGPAVVDLESAAFAAKAAARGVPCLVVRVVCDPAEEDLPFDFNQFTDERGRVRRSAVARRALLRPGSLPRLMDLRRRVERCSERLARFADAFLDGEAR